MISTTSTASQGEVVSQDLEFSVHGSKCCTDANTAGPFLIYTKRHGWIEDHTLRIKCLVMNDIARNKRIRKYKHF